jgi:hypothetical protein
LGSPLRVLARDTSGARSKAGGSFSPVEQEQHGSQTSVHLPEYDAGFFQACQRAIHSSLGSVVLTNSSMAAAVTSGRRVVAPSMRGFATRHGHQKCMLRTGMDPIAAGGPAGREISDME